MPAAAAPVSEADRFESLDLLRGFAVLGILVVNIQLFAMPFAAFVNPTALGETSSRDFLIWSAVHLLADQKFMTIFAMLFGTVDRAGQLLVMLAVWIVLLIVAPVWLARFRYGPLEWLWRRLTYGRAEPIRRGTVAVAV